MENKKESRYAFYAPPTEYGRRSYEAFIGVLTRDKMLEDMRENSEDFMDAVHSVLLVKSPERKHAYLADFELDTYAAELFYSYGVEGVPRFLMHYTEDGTLVEDKPEKVEQMLVLQSFDDLCRTMRSYNELFDSCEESWGGRKAYSLIVVMNMASARAKLDFSYYGGEEQYLSVHEVALLAGMKDASVRNVVHKELRAKSISGMTAIAAKDARHWLQNRRKFKSSTYLNSPTHIEAFKDMVTVNCLVDG
ncbi:MAG: hypothetical protein C9356_02690 [Oleiphilus sp.]|nr:MAG: hypothetical protein C9356_02690 [Oleiphilus sp.]